MTLARQTREHKAIFVDVCWSFAGFEGSNDSVSEVTRNRLVCCREMRKILTNVRVDRENLGRSGNYEANERARKRVALAASTRFSSRVDSGHVRSTCTWMHSKRGWQGAASELLALGKYNRQTKLTQRYSILFVLGENGTLLGFRFSFHFERMGTFWMKSFN